MHNAKNGIRGDRMFAFFDQIFGFLETVWEFFISLVNSLIVALTATVTAATLPVTLMPFLPAIIGSSVMIVIAFAVVKFIIGR